MIECETAQKLWKKVCEERDKATFTGYEWDYVLAFNAYIDHIENCKECKL